METNLYNSIKKLVLFGSLLGFSVIFAPRSYEMFGNLSWMLLIIIVFSRPMMDIFPDIGFFKKIVEMRKELGIMCATFGIAHGGGYFLAHNISLSSGIFNSAFWSLSSGFSWGMIAMLISIPLLLTSNRFSMKLLGKNWKNLQRFTYLFFIFTAIHIALMKPNDTTGSIVLVLAWAILRILANREIKIQLSNNRINYSVLALILLGIGSGMFLGGGSHTHEQTTQSQTSVSNTTSQTSSTGNSETTLASQTTTTKKIYISDRCVGCGKCARMAPLYFQMVNGKAQSTNQTNINETRVNNVANRCPAGAISLS